MNLNQNTIQGLQKMLKEKETLHNKRYIVKPIQEDDVPQLHKQATHGQL